MDLKNSPQSRTIKILLGIIVGLLILLLVFQLGAMVGYRRAIFASRLGDNYFRMFGPRPFAGREGDLPGGHGAVGVIVKLNLPEIIVADKSRVEKMVTVDAQTMVRLGRETASTTNLKIGDSVIVLGSPNEQGQIVARLIRILPTWSQ